MTVLFLFSGDERARISDARRESCIVHARRECGEWRGRGHHPPRQAPGGHPGNRGVESSAQRSILRPLACLRALGRRGSACARQNTVARGHALDARHVLGRRQYVVGQCPRSERKVSRVGRMEGRACPHDLHVGGNRIRNIRRNWQAEAFRRCIENRISVSAETNACDASGRRRVFAARHAFANPFAATQYARGSRAGCCVDDFRNVQD